MKPVGGQFGIGTHISRLTVDFIIPELNEIAIVVKLRMEDVVDETIGHP